MALTLSRDLSAMAEVSAKEVQIIRDAFPPVDHSTASEKAVEILQDEFGDVLSDEELVAVFEVMENATRAAMFVKMRGQVRYKWLTTQIEKLV